MKRMLLLIGGCWMVVSCIAQMPTLGITCNKTTSLIFPFEIRHVDRGTNDVLVQQVKEANNILLVKAASEKLSETNLSVVTSDGSVYCFQVNYEYNPLTLVWHLPTQGESNTETYANGILDNPRTLHGIHDRKWDMVVKVIGVYIRDNVIYYQVQLVNKSPIDYDIDFVRFCIRDNKKGKRTATQEIELKPLHISGNMAKVESHNANTLVIALGKFTIPDAKFLAIQIMEKNGGRHLAMKVGNNKIIKAIPLPDLR